MRLPNREGFRQSLKDFVGGFAFSIKFDLAKSALAKRALVAFAGRESLNQINGRAESQSHLLLPAAYSQDRLRRSANDIEHTGQ